MAAPDVSKAIRNPGRLAINPTNLSTAWPHGGTGLGAIITVEVMAFVGEISILAEEWGTTAETVYTGEQWSIACFLRGWDDDAIGQVFPNTTTGATSGLNVVTHDPVSNLPGTLGTDRAVKLLYTPDNPLNHPAVLFLEAIPALKEQAEIKLDLREEQLVPVVFRAVPSASGVPVQVGLLEDLVLP